MEKVKDPMVILSTINIGGLIGTIVYFHRKHEEMRSDIEKLTNTMKSMLTRVSALEKKDTSVFDSIAHLNSELSDLTERFKDMPSMDNLDIMSDDVNEIVKVLEDNDIEISLPSQSQYSRPSKKQSKGRKTRERNSYSEQKRIPDEKVKNREKKPQRRDEEEDDFDIISQVRSGQTV